MRRERDRSSPPGSIAGVGAGSPSPPASMRRERDRSSPPGVIVGVGAGSSSPPVSMRRERGQSIPPGVAAPASDPHPPGERPGAETPAFPPAPPKCVVRAGDERPGRAEPGPGASSSFVARIGASRHSPGAAGPNGPSSPHVTGDRVPGSASSRFAWTGPGPASPSPSGPKGGSTPSAAGGRRASPALLNASINGFMAAPRTMGARRRTTPGAASRCSRGGRGGTAGNPPPRSGSG